MTKAKEKSAKHIAEAIVDFVERVDGPVTLAQIEREIRGFAEIADRPRAWGWVTEGEDGKADHLIWDGMTKEGCAALRKVVLGRKVAIQMASQLTYRLEGRYPLDPNWAPISLLPARMANLETPRLLIRGDQSVLDMVMARAAAEGVSGFQLRQAA